jgi:hypothetical protein
MKTYWGVDVHIFTSALEGISSVSNRGRFNPRTHYIGGLVRLSASLNGVEEKSCLYQGSNPTPQPSNCCIVSTILWERLYEIENEKRWDGVDWINLADDMNRWRPLVNKVMTFRVWKFLNSWAIGSFSRRTQLHCVSYCQTNTALPSCSLFISGWCWIVRGSSQTLWHPWKWSVN